MAGDIGFLILLVGAALAVILLASWFQSRSYRGYLEKAAAENAKLVESQRQTQALL